MKKIIIIFLSLLALVFFCLPTGRVLAKQIDINSATLSQLDELTGIGPVYAQRIIDARPFSSVDDLDRVKGIGPATLQKIKTQGFACVNCQTIIEQPTPSPVPSPTQTPTQTPTPTATPEPSLRASPQASVAILTPVLSTSSEIALSAASPLPRNNEIARILFNEVLPNPKGADETEEWIELHNTNDFSVDLSGWKIKDIEGSVTTFIFADKTKIEANGYLVLKRLETKIILQNNKDGLQLFWPNGKLADSMSYEKAPLDQSYNRIANQWAWSTTLTPGLKNVITLAKVNTTPTLPNKEKSDNNKNNLEPAALSEPIKTNDTNPWFLFLGALLVATVFGVTILFFKFKLKF